MKQVVCDYQSASLVNESELNEVRGHLKGVVETMRAAAEGFHQTPYDFLRLPHDTEYVQSVLKTVDQCKKKNVGVLVVIGIGGSNLGTQAVYEALYGRFANEVSAVKVYFVDTVDTDTVADQLRLVEQSFRAKTPVLLNIVTKSGSTIETVANGQAFIDLLRRYHPNNANDFIVVTTDQGSSLASYARDHKMMVLEIPRGVGGRYSVFSAVGLFPLAFFGVDIQQLCLGAQDAQSTCLIDQVSLNDAMRSALVKYVWYGRGVRIHDHFLYAPRLMSFGLWYRQLMGESIGKVNDEGVAVGITPTVSIGSTDLHSVVQVYLAGPRDRFTTFITVKNPEQSCVVPPHDYLPHTDLIRGKSMRDIMSAIEQGTMAAYQQHERPYAVITIDTISAYTIGALLQMYMIEMVMLGTLLKVNPFDQPAVESYKKVTSRVLGQSSALGLGRTLSCT